MCASTENASVTQASTDTAATRFSNALVVVTLSRVTESARMETVTVSLDSVGWSVRRRSAAALTAVVTACVLMACAIATLVIMDPHALNQSHAQATAVTMEPAATERATVTQDMEATIAPQFWSALMTAVVMVAVCSANVSAIPAMEARTVLPLLSALSPHAMTVQQDSAAAMENVPMESASAILDSLVTTAPHV